MTKILASPALFFKGPTEEQLKILNVYTQTTDLIQRNWMGFVAAFKDCVPLVISDATLNDIPRIAVSVPRRSDYILILRNYTFDTVTANIFVNKECITSRTLHKLETIVVPRMNEIVGDTSIDVQFSTNDNKGETLHLILRCRDKNALDGIINTI